MDLLDVKQHMLVDLLLHKSKSQLSHKMEVAVAVEVEAGSLDDVLACP